MYKYVQEIHFIPKSFTLEYDWKKHDRHSVYVIAQQFSFSTCV